MALPTAVPRCIWKPSMAATSDARSSVARWATWLLPAKVTSPTSICLGRSRRNDLAASCAASSRVGLTSLTRMLSDTSIASMIVERAHGSGTCAAGRAAASSSPVQASRSNAGGTCRRHWRPAAAARTTPRLLYRRAALPRRRSSQTYTAGSRGSASNSQRYWGHRKDIARRLELVSIVPRKCLLGNRKVVGDDLHRDAAIGIRGRGARALPSVISNRPSHDLSRGIAELRGHNPRRYS